MAQATKQELRAVRKELNDKTTLIYQGLIFGVWGYVNGETKLQDPNTSIDFKIVLIKEAINIWNTQTYNISNISKIFKPGSNVGNWEVVLKQWLDFKNTGKLNDYSNYTQKRVAIPEIFDDYTDELIELDSAKPYADRYEKLREYWRTDFKADFDNKLLDVDSLKLVKAKLNQGKPTDYDAIKKERDNWVAVFPSPLTPDLVKTKYDEKKETHGEKDLKPTNLPDNWESELKRIPELDKRPTQEDLNNAVKNETDKYKDYETIKTERDQLIKDKTTVENNLKTANDTITNLTNEKSGLETKLKNKEAEITKLGEQTTKGNEYLKKLLETYKEIIADETEAFYQSLDLDETDDIRREYAKDYLKELDKLNGEADPNNIINAFRIIALVIATEKAMQENRNWGLIANKEPQFINSKLEYFNRIKKQWDVNWGLKPTETNNPLWIDMLISDKVKRDYRGTIRDIVIEWQRIQPITKTTIEPSKTVKTVELDIFPIAKTSFGLLREVLNRKVRMVNYIQVWKDFSPQTKSIIETVEAEHIDRLNSLTTETQYASFQIYFDYFNKRKSILKEAKSITIKNLTELFKEDEKDDKIIKFLKQVAIEQTPSWETQIRSWQAGVAGLLFMTESMKTFYLGNLVLFIFNSLNTAGVKFEEIQEPLKKILIDKPDGIFTILYSGFVSTDKQRDLDDFEKGINRKLKELEILINNTKENKKNEEHQAKDKQYLNKLLAVYKEQITEETENFYLEELNLDESKNINPKYWGRGERADGDNPKSYSEKLNELNGDSEPEQVINAFKIVALISATEKIETISKEWIDKPSSKKPAFKNNKIEEFTKIKKQWELNSELKSIKDNNPLWLDIINDKETYKNKLNEIILLWQNL
jgi:hypothetical protein